MPYSRESPSPEYLRLIKEYRSLHLKGSETPPIPKKSIFAGMSTFKAAEKIRRCLIETPCLTLLNYGCGKGQQYQKIFRSSEKPDELSTLKDYWRLKSIACYDPAYPPFEKMPKGTFDAVICIDVLEHVPREDLEWILQEIFSKANRLVYLAISCFPARKTLQSGENAHCIIEPPKWWHEEVEKTAAAFPKIKRYIVCESS
ncbi:putative uncharacterized protein [Waddlia chondrophila 2032/99]|uniref:Class I SAM-dependent methyltransferase n=2 Tax=Waddlia chondrophila TaxID=71667 RepID=D6YTS8_WADCW|nr:class I SAM-dependent methyltransferase [Waddlia chondrophila]ADI37539.1 hypothetical protein wcw_0164 [Waddlia chondrophila WSU 86-1044]CCB91801.1 putative uncharacterized protein [Waddlia chondrophila 2032/99]